MIYITLSPVRSLKKKKTFRIFQTWAFFRPEGGVTLEKAVSLYHLMGLLRFYN
jgi:hypothetical protein